MRECFQTLSSHFLGTVKDIVAIAKCNRPLRHFCDVLVHFNVFPSVLSRLCCGITVLCHVYYFQHINVKPLRMFESSPCNHGKNKLLNLLL